MELQHKAAYLGLSCSTRPSIQRTDTPPFGLSDTSCSSLRWRYRQNSEVGGYAPIMSC